MRHRILAASIGIAALVTVGCSPTSAPETTPGTLAGTDLDSDATLITVITTIPADDELPAAIASAVATRVPEVIGVVLDRDQVSCVADGILDDADPDALELMGLGGDLQDQPLALQATVFAVFDRCVGPTDYARVAAPILMTAGAQRPVAECVFREIRGSLGFAGLYAYAVDAAGGGAADARLGEQVADAYDTCDLEPTSLSVPLGPPTTLAPGASSTAVATTSPTTTLAPGAAPVTATSTTVVPPIAPPEDAVVTTTRSVPTTVAATPTASTGG